MPVRFKGNSEYDRSYEWRDSYKSSSFSPSKEQAASTAGNPSGYSEPVFEPPLQRKKKPIPLTTTSTTKFFTNPEPDDFTLLGAQNKFAPNVVYKTSAPYQATRASLNNNNASPQKEKKRDSKSKTFRVQRKDRLKPAPVVDTTNYRPPSPIAPRSPGERKKILKDTRKVVNGNSKTLPEPAPRANGTTSDTNGKLANGKTFVSNAAKNNNAVDSQRSSAPDGGNPPGLSVKPKHQLISNKTQVLNKKAPPPKPGPVMMDAIKAKRSGSMNEYVQTDLGKGVTESAPEAPQEFALKHRAGIAPPRPDKKRKTEYQKEFSWKRPVDSAPLLTAEEVVYGSHSNLSPSKSDLFSKETEYNRQFRPWHLYSKPVQENINNSATNAKLKRSKSEAELVPRSEEERRLIKEAQNPLKFHAPHGKHRKWKTEYKSNYNPPAKFKYEGGAWKGAAPPHVHSQENLADPEAIPPVSNWYAEVLELRNKADEYRKRSLGTHFSREHVAQLLARQAELWDEVSSNASLSALSLESAGVANVSNNNRALKPAKPDSVDKPAAAPKPAQSKPSSVNRTREDVKRKLAWGETDSVSSFSGKTSTASTPGSSESTLINSDDDGRTPTPELKQTGETRRHHLDVTTPATGGAILVSPPPKGKQQKQSADFRPPAGITYRKDPITSSSDLRPVRSTSQSQQAPRPERLSKPSHIPGGPYYRRYSDESSESSSGPMETSLLRPKPQIRETKRSASSVPPLTLPPDSSRSRLSDVATMSSGNPSTQCPSCPSVRSSYVPETRQSGTSPTLGMPTQDTHELLDEGAPYDIPLKTQFVHSPSSKQGAVRERPNSGSAYGRPLSAMPQRRQLDNIDEGMGQTFISPPNRGITRDDLAKLSPAEDDDDTLSTSMQSLASSSSLASETLERARSRRDEFWGKPGATRR